ncbi:MAG: HAD-IB family hydrolase [Patescibacteria group bacterium]|jgi:HAD superfamily hydrolase (TIGR01490 family)
MAKKTIVKPKKASGQRKVAIFDIDGTIFRSSLLIEITEALIHAGIFKKKLRKMYEKPYQRWLDRTGHYDDYIGGVIKAFEGHIKGVDSDVFMRVAERVVDFHKDRVYRYTRDLVRDLKKKGYFLLAISNSPREVLKPFCAKLGFDKVYGRIYEVDKNNRFTGTTLFLDMISDKAVILRRAIARNDLTLKGSIGVGDTQSDIRFLQLVEQPICFNPNMVLYRHARRRGWEIVVERKDVVHHFGPLTRVA